MVAHPEAVARRRLRQVTVVAVLQPGYLPWLGFFEQMHSSHVFVLLDDVQYDKNGWRNRNRIRTPNDAGWSWLTVPVAREHLIERRIMDVRIAPGSWASVHWRALRHSYSRAPYFADHASFFEELYARPWERLVDLDLAIIDYLAGALGIRRRMHRASELAVAGRKTDRLIEICRRLGATRYYSGAVARAYLDVDQMRAAGIEVEFQDFRHPVYAQVYRPFVPYLSVVDLLFNCGPRSLDVLLGRGSAAASA